MGNADLWYTPVVRIWVADCGCSRPLRRAVPGAAGTGAIGLIDRAARGLQGSLRSVGNTMAHQRERRSTTRSNLERRAMFVAMDGSTLLQAGVVTDMSRDGLHLRTRQPAPVGTVIEIEMDPRDGAQQSSPIITRGRVVRVQELANGEYSVGVKLRYRIARPTPVPGVKSEAPAATASPVRRAARMPLRVPKVDLKQWSFIAVLLAMIAIAILWPRQTPTRTNSGSGGAAKPAASLPEAI
ncbi:MAG: hypothetical protein FJY92_03165, partial [Candidatus Hydrogenedentes bacterium]|nr:hypothetical protein [Candidatus Hydrogenedentota bacterium]